MKSESGCSHSALRIIREKEGSMRIRSAWSRVLDRCGGRTGGGGAGGGGGLLMKEKAFVVYPADRPVCG